MYFVFTILVVLCVFKVIHKLLKSGILRETRIKFYRENRRSPYLASQDMYMAPFSKDL